MTFTIQSVVTEVMQTIGVTGTGKSPTPAQNPICWQVLNDNLLTQMKDGWVNLGWFPNVTPSPTTVAPLRDADRADIVLIACEWFAPKFGVRLEDPILLKQIEDAFRRLSKRYLRYTECDLGELSRPQGGPWGGPNYL